MSTNCKKMKRIVFTFALLSLVFTPGIVLAADTGYAAFLTIETTRLKVLAEDGAKLFLQKQANVADHIDSYGSYQRLSVADAHSQTGVEWFLYSDSGSVLDVHSQYGGSRLESFEVYGPDKSVSAVITAGELIDEEEGIEVAVCQQRHMLPRVKVYNYSELSGFTEVLKFAPFGQERTSKRGCRAMAIGDVDGDGEDELVVSRGNTRGRLMKIFDAEGKLESKFYFQGATLNQGYPLVVQDITGDGIGEIIFYGDTVRAINGEGSSILTLDLRQLFGNTDGADNFTVGDVNGDGVSELLIQKMGRKAKVAIVDGSGVKQREYLAFPNATQKRNRYLFFGPFEN